ncbi:MAG: hypothetical protein ACRCYY_21745 [Trueperaceae bacterium]
MTFTMGEEVLYDGERFVIWGMSDDEPKRYRLLATTKQGMKIVWVSLNDLDKISKYTKSQDDTASYL